MKIVSGLVAGSGNYSEKAIGAVVGHLKSGSVINCSNNAIVFRDTTEMGYDCTLGGVVGMVSNDPIGESLVTECSNTGTVVNKCSYETLVAGSGKTGGVIGAVSALVHLNKCKNTGSVSGYRCVGGVIGSSENNGRSIYGCANTGAIRALSHHGLAYVGGIAGDCDNFSIEGCYNTGDLSAGLSSSSDIPVVGGITSRISPFHSLKYSYSAATFTLDGATPDITRIGKLFGDNGAEGNGNSPEVLFCFYLVGQPELSFSDVEKDWIGPEEAKTEAELKGFDIIHEKLQEDRYLWDATGSRSFNKGYPVFSWEEGIRVGRPGTGEVTGLNTPGDANAVKIAQYATFGHVVPFSSGNNTVETFGAAHIAAADQDSDGKITMADAIKPMLYAPPTDISDVLADFMMLPRMGSDLRPGGSIEMDVFLNTNNMFSAGAFQVNYPHEFLELESVNLLQENFVSGGFMSKLHTFPEANNPADDDKFGVICLDPWHSYILQNQPAFTLKFKIKDYAVGSFPVSLALVDDLPKNFVNTAGAEIPVHFTGTEISVTQTRDNPVAAHFALDSVQVPPDSEVYLPVSVPVNPGVYKGTFQIECQDPITLIDVQPALLQDSAVLLRTNKIIFEASSKYASLASTTQPIFRLTLKVPADTPAGDYRIRFVPEGTSELYSVDGISDTLYPIKAYFSPEAGKITVTSNTKPVPTLNDIRSTLADYTYDGTAREVLVAPASGVSGLGQATVHFYQSDGTELRSPPSNAGSYTVTVDFDEGPNYAAVKGLTLGSLTIAKAPAPEVPWPPVVPVLVETYPLSSLSFTPNSSVGSFAWSDASATFAPGDRKAKMVFTQADTSNYEQAAVTTIDYSLTVHMLGDVDNDGVITAFDFLTIARYSAGLYNPPQAGSLDFKIADMDKDGALSSGDAVSALRKSLGL